MARFNYLDRQLEWHYFDSGIDDDQIMRINIPYKGIEAIGLTGLIDGGVVLTVQLLPEFSPLIEQAKIVHEPNAEANRGKHLLLFSWSNQ